MKNIVAIVGRPNVGKSSLFNKLINRRVAIVYDAPGVTRDRIYHDVEWNKHHFKIIDTGGIAVNHDDMQEKIKVQAQIAIEEASIIIFMVDGRQGLTPDDEFIANILRRAKNKHIIVGANKLENINDFDNSIWSLGFDIYKISTIHGNGIGDLLDDVISHLDQTSIEKNKHLKLIILGKPNSGKSSLLNALVKSNRAIVSPIANTTRDSIKSLIEIDNTTFEIIDTAGINKKSRLVESVDHYALMRAKGSLEEADIVLLMVDSTKDFSHFDARIIGYAMELFKPIILIMNKWDLIHKTPTIIRETEKKIRDEFKFVSWAPIVFISALKQTNLTKLTSTILLVAKNMQKYLKTSLINNLLLDIQAIQPASAYRGGRLHISFGQQIHAKIPTFIFKVNNKQFLHFSFSRAIENKIREHFGFEGTPIKLIFRDNERNKHEKNKRKS